ncbi:RHS repeat domain-containing protein [Paenibacillus bovis]|uniref:Teneurin-like YD-shell domain-containing protein n=1 Tax=Paenibacillus bovis TaxID=1616788 RepID=A0A172ZK86_9BACL|nr:RHS repeat domain-containing protein [Paenibacillus bovis]ANF97949.1 hypothetical protein AR543_19280 [Paenibacillus bovis]
MIQNYLRKIAIVLFSVSILFSAVLTASAASTRVYEYDVNGRLITTYTATQKVTYIYDKNGNLLNKKVEKGNYTANLHAANKK